MFCTGAGRISWISARRRWDTLPVPQTCVTPGPGLRLCCLFISVLIGFYIFFETAFFVLWKLVVKRKSKASLPVKLGQEVRGFVTINAFQMLALCNRKSSPTGLLVFFSTGSLADSVTVWKSYLLSMTSPPLPPSWRRRLRLPDANGLAYRRSS